MSEGVGALAEWLEEALGGDHQAQWRITAGDPLRGGDDVGHVVEVSAGKHRADPTKGADGLVRHQEYVVLVADFADPLEVARGRREAAASILHRLEEYRCHRVGAFEEDRLFDAIGCP